MPCGITIESKPQSSSFSKSSAGVVADSRQSRGSSRTGTPRGQSRARPAPPDRRRGRARRASVVETVGALKSGLGSTAPTSSTPSGRPARDRPRRNLVVGEIAQDDVLVAVVRLRRRADLRPLPAEDRSRDRDSSPSPAIALHWRIDSIVSSQRVGVSVRSWSLIDKKSRDEQKRAKSQASATGCAPSPPLIGRREREGVEGEGRVDVEVAEEDLLRLGDADRAAPSRTEASFAAMKAGSIAGPVMTPTTGRTPKRPVPAARMRIRSRDHRHHQNARDSTDHASPWPPRGVQPAATCVRGRF